MLNNSFVVRLADIQPLQFNGDIQPPEGFEYPDIREEVTLKGSFSLEYDDRTNNAQPSMIFEFTEETLEFFKKALNREELNISATVSGGIISVSVN